MLDLDQMTPETLMANINLYTAIRRTQREDLTPEDEARLDALTKERQRRIVAARGNLRPGLYVTSAWKEEPHKGLLWSLDENGRWELRTDLDGDTEFRETRATPEGYFGVGWERRLVKLEAVREG